MRPRTVLAAVTLALLRTLSVAMRANAQPCTPSEMATFVYPVGKPSVRPTASSASLTANGYMVTRRFRELVEGVRHTGADLANGAEGGDVRSIGCGTVVRVRLAPTGFGNLVRIQHDVPGVGTVYAQYAHLKDGSIRVGEGNRVNIGTVIGAVDCSGATAGNSSCPSNGRTGPHLHLAIQLMGDRNGCGYLPDARCPNDTLSLYLDPLEFIASHPRFPLATFTYTSTGTGTIGTTAFSNSPFTITGVASTADRTPLPSQDNTGFFIDHVLASIVIIGVGDYKFTSSTRTFVSNTHSVAGFSRGGSSGADLVYAPASAGLGTWDMLSSFGPVSGTGRLLQWSFPSVSTDGGVLVLNDDVPPVSFQAFAGSRLSFNISLSSTVMGLSGGVSGGEVHISGSVTNSTTGDQTQVDLQSWVTQGTHTAAAGGSLLVPLGWSGDVAQLGVVKASTTLMLSPVYHIATCGCAAAGMTPGPATLKVELRQVLGGTTVVWALKEFAVTLQ